MKQIAIALRTHLHLETPQTTPLITLITLPQTRLPHKMKLIPLIRLPQSATVLLLIRIPPQIVLITPPPKILMKREKILLMEKETLMITTVRALAKEEIDFYNLLLITQPIAQEVPLMLPVVLTVQAPTLRIPRMLTAPIVALPPTLPLTHHRAIVQLFRKCCPLPSWLTFVLSTQLLTTHSYHTLGRDFSKTLTSVILCNLHRSFCRAMVTPLTLIQLQRSTIAMAVVAATVKSTRWSS